MTDYICKCMRWWMRQAPKKTSKLLIMGGKVSTQQVTTAESRQAAETLGDQLAAVKSTYVQYCTKAAEEGIGSGSGSGSGSGGGTTSSLQTSPLLLLTPAILSSELRLDASVLEQIYRYVDHALGLPDLSSPSSSNASASAAVSAKKSPPALPYVVREATYVAACAWATCGSRADRLPLHLGLVATTETRMTAAAAASSCLVSSASACALRLGPLLTAADPLRREPCSALVEYLAQLLFNTPAAAAAATASAASNSSSNSGSYNGGGGGGSGGVGADAIEQWVADNPVVENLLDVVLSGLVHPPRPASSWMLDLPGVDSSGPGSSLIEPGQTYVLNAALPPALRGQWTRLFNTRTDGKSYAALRRELLGAGAATLLVVRDRSGHVFGGFVSEPWRASPDFYGHESSFLFRLQPVMSVHRAGRYNTNFQYFNSGMEMLPNGIAMGGQLNYFGLYLAPDCETGHSKAHPLCSTFQSPCLSSEEEFAVDAVELWRVGPEPVDEEEGEEGTGDSRRPRASVLDGNTEAQMLLEMAGRKMHSRHLRPASDESESEAEETEANPQGDSVATGE